MSEIYDLRLKMIELVRAGLIERAEYDSLFEVLCEAHNLLPAHRPDVVRAVQLIGKLLPAPAADPAPNRGGRVVVLGSPDVVKDFLQEVHLRQLEYRGKSAWPEFVGLAHQFDLLEQERTLQQQHDLHEQWKADVVRSMHDGRSAVDVLRCGEVLHLEAGQIRITDADFLRKLYGPPPQCLEAARNLEVGTSMALKFRAHFHEQPEKMPKQFPKQPYQGYMDSRHRRRKK